MNRARGAGGPSHPRLTGVDSRTGQPLPSTERAFFEPRIGFVFSNVRIHTDAGAARSARAVGAKAYTVGSNVVFGAGRWAPKTSAGRRLIAHELTHVVQQGTAPGASPRIQRQPRGSSHQTTGVADQGRRPAGDRACSAMEQIDAVVDDGAGSGSFSNVVDDS